MKLTPRSIVHLSLLALSCANAHAQSLYQTGFEAPIYTAGYSALGVYGWEVNYWGGNYRGWNQVVTDRLASEGDQSLLFDNSGTDLSANALQTTLFSRPGLNQTSVKIYMAAGNGSGRIAELSLSSINGYYGYGPHLSIGGDGAVRAGGDAWSGRGGIIGYAQSGTFSERWLTLSMTYDTTTGLVTQSVSGFGGSQSPFTASFNMAGYEFTKLQIGSIVNDDATFKDGVVYFDDVSVTAVPEPASCAALAIGLLLASRRRGIVAK